MAKQTEYTVNGDGVTDWERERERVKEIEGGWVVKYIGAHTIYTAFVTFSKFKFYMLMLGELKIIIIITVIIIIITIISLTIKAKILFLW